MNKKKIIVSIIILAILLMSGWGLYYYFGNEDEKSTLTLAEKQWIEKNKNNIVDIGIVNNIPIFNYEGDGLFFDFIKSIEKDTDLEFNEISYDDTTQNKAEYSFNISSGLKENDILIYEDNYAIVSNKKGVYTDLQDIPNIVLGVTKNNLDNINFYLYDNKNITYKTFDTNKDLFDEITSQSSSVNAIAVPKTITLNQIISNKLNINYNISDAKINLVLTLGNQKKLNTIIKKYYKKWETEKYIKSYNNHFKDNYFTFNNIYEDSIAKFSGKQYKYGFISNAPYTTLVDGKIVGISNEYMKKFAEIANIEINYKEYKSSHDLIKEFNENKIDFYLNTFSNKKYDMDVYDTVSITDGKVAIVSGEKNNLITHSLSSLKDQEVVVIAGSKIATYLKGYGIKIKEVNNFDNVINNLKEDTIIAIDEKSFDLYRYKKLKNYKIYYAFDLNSNYNYTIRNIKDNKIFSDFFNFYVSFLDGKPIENKVTHDLYEINIKNHFVKYLIIIFSLIVVGFTVMFVITKKPFKKDKKNVISKDNKLKYIDMLTSLKNRNYLNDQIEKWDNSEIYPQAIIIVDLNNIAYINDNYGHEEGDNVIKQAANILITTQIENSEIMRTNGNEFLIYMVENDEKQIITYIRNINKQMKELSHGFGAAVGYSMIVDGLKTVDDAINEATLDMKNNKEEINN